MPIARYTQKLMDDFAKMGCAAILIREPSPKEIGRQRSRMHNASNRLGVHVNTYTMPRAAGLSGLWLVGEVAK